MISDQGARSRLQGLVNEAPYLELTPSEVLALERAIFLLTREIDGGKQG